MGARVLMTLGCSAGFLVIACEGQSPSATESAPVSEVPAPAEALAKPPVGRAVAMTREQRVEALKRVLEPRLDRSREGLEVETFASGKRGVHLHGRFGHATVLRVKPDGTRERGCFDDAKSAAEFAAPEAP
jgi:hypothetical protein